MDIEVLKNGLRQQKEKLAENEEELRKVSLKVDRMNKDTESLKTEIEDLRKQETATLEKILKGSVEQEASDLESIRKAIQERESSLKENKMFVDVANHMVKDLSAKLPVFRSSIKETEKIILAHERDRLSKEAEPLSDVIARLWVLHVKGVRLPLADPYTNQEYLDFLGQVFPMKKPGLDYAVLGETMIKELSAE